MHRCGRIWRHSLFVAMLLLGSGAAPAKSAFNDPLFVFSAGKNVSPGTGFQGPCGLTVDAAANFYVSDYYHHVIDVFKADQSFVTQITNVDPLDGPCGLGLDSTGKLYVNDYNRDVVRFTPSAYPPSPNPRTTFGGATLIDSSHPTGLAVGSGNDVYVDLRTQIAVYDSSGAPTSLTGIGQGILGDGYGLAISRFPATGGQIYVPDAADDTVKVYHPATSTTTPVATIAGPPGGFVSLVDSAVAVSAGSGDLYVADHVGSRLTENPESAIHVFDYTGAYKGRLKYNVIDGRPVGIAVDNSAGSTQGRVYVTSGNGVQARVYAYPPGAASAAVSPAAFRLTVATNGDGEGSVHSARVGIDCSSACQAEVPAGDEVVLTAAPATDSTFVGWSGEGCGEEGTCVVEMDEAAAVTAGFVALPESPAPGRETPVVPAAEPASSAGSAPISTRRSPRTERRQRARKRRQAKRRGQAVERARLAEHRNGGTR